jgi:beta-lactamase regulating signal transducer with metallopeptidase domain
MIVWMVYSAVIALIVAIAARAVESLARVAGYRVRWIWAGALALTLFLSASAPFRIGQAVPAVAMRSSHVTSDYTGDAADAAWLTTLSARVEGVRRSIASPFQRAMVVVDHTASPAANAGAGSLAVAISLGLTIVFVAVGRRFRRARQTWPLVTMEGVDVRVAPRVGPLVIGVLHPEIVVPRWLLGRDAADQRLVVAHENEHVRARDPLLLGAALIAGVVAPWNPAVWYMLSRLRLAIELDCDARVLRRGAAPRSYGSLLIDVAEHASGLRLSALALADDSSHLHQRLLAMGPRAPRFARLRSGFAAAFALVAVLVACEASLPADGETGNTSGAAALATRETEPTTHVVIPTPPPSIGRLKAVNTKRNAPRKQVAARATPATARADSNRLQRIAPTEPVTVDSGNALGLIGAKATAQATPIVIIDGVRSTMDQLRSIARDQIEGIEIVKGPAAAQAYNDPEAVNGVIGVTTKRNIKRN